VRACMGACVLVCGLHVRESACERVYMCMYCTIYFTVRLFRFPLFAVSVV